MMELIRKFHKANFKGEPPQPLRIPRPGDGPKTVKAGDLLRKMSGR